MRSWRAYGEGNCLVGIDPQRHVLVMKVKKKGGHGGPHTQSLHTATLPKIVILHPRSLHLRLSSLRPGPTIASILLVSL